jgi:hypothetical protein
MTIYRDPQDVSSGEYAANICGSASEASMILVKATAMAMVLMVKGVVQKVDQG